MDNSRIKEKFKKREKKKTKQKKKKKNKKKTKKKKKGTNNKQTKNDFQQASVCKIPGSSSSIKMTEGLIYHLVDPIWNPIQI